MTRLQFIQSTEQELSIYVIGFPYEIIKQQSFRHKLLAVYNNIQNFYIEVEIKQWKNSAFFWGGEGLNGRLLVHKRIGNMVSIWLKQVDKWLNQNREIKQKFVFLPRQKKPIGI